MIIVLWTLFTLLYFIPMVILFFASLVSLYNKRIAELFQFRTLSHVITGFIIAFMPGLNLVSVYLIAEETGVVTDMLNKIAPEHLKDFD